MSRFMIRLTPILGAFVLAITGASAQTVTITSPVNAERINLNQTGVEIEVQFSYTGTAVGAALFVNGANIGFSCGWGGGIGSCLFTATDTVCSPVLQVQANILSAGVRYSNPIQVFFYDDTNPTSSCLPNPPQCATDQAGGSVGGPINVVTGDMHYEVEDVLVPSPLPIRVTRRYDSQHPYSGPFGIGFRHRYDTRMECGKDPNNLGDHCKHTDPENNVTYRGRTAVGFAAPWYSLHNSGFNGSQLTEPDQTIHTFSNGKLASIQDRNGNTLTFAYTGDNLTSITDTFGRQVTFGYTGSLVTTVTRPDGEQIIYGYTGSKLTTVTYPDGVILTYEYTDPAHPDNLTAVKDKYEHVLESWAYDAQNRATHYERERPDLDEEPVDAVTLAYDTPSAGQTRVTDGLGNVTDYAVDKLKRVVTDVVGPCQSCGGGFNEQHFVWDAFQRITQITDGKGVVTELQWDNSSPIKFRNLTQRIEAKNTMLERATRFCYDPTFNFVTTTKVKSVGTCSIPDDCGGTTTDHSVVINSYDTVGNLMSRQVKSCEGATAKTYTSTYSYDSKGQRLTANGPRTPVPDDVTTYTYYPSNDPQYGFLATEMNGLSHVTQYSNYDEMGHVGTVLDVANDVTTTLTYDPMGRLASTTIHGDSPAEDIVTSYTYDDHVGHLATVTDPRTYVTTYAEDAAHRLTDVTDPLGNVVHTGYDDMSRRNREEYRDDLGVVQRFTNFAHDAFGRLKHACFTGAVTDCPSGAVHTTLLYDGNGNLMTEEDAEGHVTSYVYDELNRLDTVTQTVDGTSLITDYDYDVQDNLASVRDPELLLTSYTYSDTGWRLGATSPDTGTMTYTYDEAGNLEETTDANGISVTMAYDSLNRLTTTSYPDASLNVIRSYDSPSVSFGIGRRTGMTDPSGATVYHYDRRGLPAKEEKTIGATMYTTEYVHDRSGNLTEIKYPADDPLTRQGRFDFVWDPGGRVSDITAQVNGSTVPVATGILYKPFGPPRSITFQNGRVDGRSYDTRYRLGTWTVGGLLNYSHGYDDDDNVTSRADLMDPDPSKDLTFGYDDIHRLTTAIGPWGPGTACGGVTYRYDKNGNRSCKGERDSLVLAPTMYTYVPSTNRLAAATGGEPALYGHDDNGNMTGDGTVTYVYNQATRLEAVQDTVGSTIAAYTYDGDGRRVIKEAGGNTTYYFYDPAGQLLTELDVDAGTGKDYGYLLDTPIARVDWAVGEQSIGNYLRVGKSPPNVHLEWSLSPGSAAAYAVRRKRVVGPNDWSFDGNVRIATVSGKTYDDPGLEDGNDYEYRVFQRTAADALFFYHTDRLGTPIAMTDSLGVPVWRAEYLPFGEVDLTTSVVVNDLRFPGQYFDNDISSAGTIVHYNWNRWHDVRAGRYTQTDPVFLAGFSPYSYALDDPIDVKDPEGLLPAGTDTETTCLICTVYAEARGQSPSCQYAVASVILNRLGTCRKFGSGSICGIVSSPGQFDGYGNGNSNYRSCDQCGQVTGELADTVRLFQTPFSVGPQATYYGNNTVPIVRYFKQKLGLSPVAYPSCGVFAFFTEVRDPFVRPRRPPYCR